MPKTKTEKRLLQQQKLAERGGLLVPVMEEFLKSPLGIDTAEDARWLHDLAMKQVKRESERQDAYERGTGVFSPSGLGDCLRRVYLGKNHREHGLERISLPAIEPHYYFFTGDFIHLKWQFAFHKLSGVHPDIHLVDCEIPIMSKRKDHGGTLDMLLLFHDEALIVDVKGLNVRSFHGVSQGEASATHQYRVQLTDYGMLFNSALQRGTWKPPKTAMKYLRDRGIKKFPKVSRLVLLAENKGGPDQAHPAALGEFIISLKEHLPEVRLRLEELRRYDEEKEIPPIECESTRLIQFTGCPFAGFCHKEVKRAEEARNKARSSKQLRISQPKRRRRSR